MEQYISNIAAPPVLTGNGTLKDAVHAFERSVILESLKANNDDKRKVARLLGISISSLYRKISELSIGEERSNGTGERPS